MKSSVNANDEDVLTGAFNVLSNYINKKMQNSLPVKVTWVSEDRKKVNVQPQIMIVGTDGTPVPRGEIKGIPVSHDGAGGFLFSFPIKIGDLGWIDASDRDISLFTQSYSEVKPNTKRMHSFSDARFIPDIMTNFTIAEEDSAAMVIQNRDSTVKISLDNDRIKIKAPKLVIETTGDVDVTCGGNMVANVTGNVDITSSTFNVTASGGANINGFTIDSIGAAESPVSLTAPSAFIDGKELAEHTHSAGNYKVGSTPVSENSGVNN